MEKDVLSQHKSAKPLTPVAGLLLQRKCGGCGQHTVAGGGCSECEKGKGFLQRRATGNEATGEAPPIVDEVLRSPGQPLDASTRKFMEPRFGHDFSQVPVYTDMNAAQSRATVGQPGNGLHRETDSMADAMVRKATVPDNGQMGSTLPFREATELAACIRIMGEESTAYCREVVLGEKPEIIVNTSPWARKHTSGPRLLDGRSPSYQVWFDHILPTVPAGVKQLWQVVEVEKTFLTDQCEEKTEKEFRVDIVDIGARKNIQDDWVWIRRDNPCFAMEVNKATVGFDDQVSNFRQQTNVKVSEADAIDTIGKMAGPVGTYSGVYTFVKSGNCSTCPEKLKEIQKKNKARNGEALTIEGVGAWTS